MRPYTTLIGAEELAQHLEYQDWRIFDCRHDLLAPDAGEHAYDAGHIIGARFLGLERDLSSPATGRNGRHPLPDPQRLAERLGSCGVGEQTQIVAYDDSGGMFAARLWWLARWLGHERVAVLDGGLAAWRSVGLPLASGGAGARAAMRLEVEPRPIAVDAERVRAQLGDPQMLIVDARSPERFRGENETLDPVGGHIPGAVNRWFKDNLDERGRFKPAAQLRTEWLSLLGQRSAQAVVHTCGSGVSACHNLLAMEIAGLQGSRLYPGSWSEWCADPSRPVATGAG